MPKFLDGPQGSPRAAVHILLAGEKVALDHLLPAADVTETIVDEGVRFLNLEALVRMELTSHRLKDQVHILDLIDIGLIDQSWPARYPPELAKRLQVLLDDPNG